MLLDPTQHIKALRLEAIFHPKFDNEHLDDTTKQQQQQQRQHMKKKVDVTSTAAVTTTQVQQQQQQHVMGGSSSSSSSRIRQIMMRRLMEHKGYLEVSLKHSGSLVLWSGDERYYSKNSARNQFTQVGEILLRQHFCRVWLDDDDEIREENGSIISDSTTISKSDVGDFNTSKSDIGTVLSETQYRQCRDYIQRHRLTVAFEVVTAVLGDHGAIPSRDFMIVTAVADRSTERFLTTSQVTEFCQRFLLPHNDVWTFETTESAAKLFELYDTSRETGLAHDTVPALTTASDIYVPSMYPHSIFQGDILEGFIIRYVPHHKTAADLTVGNGRNTNLKELAVQAHSILQHIPPTKPPCFEILKALLVTETHNQLSLSVIPTVLMADIRAIEKAIPYTIERGGDKKLHFNTALERSKIFSDQLNQLLIESTAVPICCDDVKDRKEMAHPDNGTVLLQRHDLVKVDQGATQSTKHLPSLVQHLEHSRDVETRRIVQLLQTLENLKGSVTYNMMASSTSTAEGETTYKLYCMIHVIHDTTFFRFQKQQKVDDMTLFRGFCVELLSEEPNLSDTDSCEIPTTTAPEEPVENAATEVLVGTGNDDDNNNLMIDDKMLMLKMKLLPYMVRTFICRNLLKILLKDQNPHEFIQKATSLLDRWSISPSGQRKWMPFVEGWAVYVIRYQQRHNDDQGVDDGRNGEHALGPLTDSCYLRHLEYYSELFKKGENGSLSSLSASSKLCDFVCVIAQSVEIAEAIARKIAVQLGDTNETMVMSVGDAATHNRLQNCIAYGSLADKSNAIRNFLTNKVVLTSVLVLYGSNPDEVAACAFEPSSSWLALQSKGDIKRVQNMWKKPWTDFPCAKRILLSQSSVKWEEKENGATKAVISSFSQEFQDVVRTIEATVLEFAENEKQRNTEPRQKSILVFFPGIPGCGKSSLVEGMESELERHKAPNEDTGSLIGTRKAYVRVGDKVGKKFWDVVEGLLSDNGSQPAIVIADKNTPPPSWQKLGQICGDTHTLPLTVLPDPSVLQTTTIRGSRSPDGTFHENRSHFYPFSLTYLAICIMRVLHRPAGAHDGKLDSGHPTAAMIVVQFYSFYRYLSAENLVECMRTKLENAGAESVDVVEPVRLLVSKDGAKADSAVHNDGNSLPKDLEAVLVEALQLRHGYDTDKKAKIPKDDPQTIATEQKLRTLIGAHGDVIQSMTVSLDESRKSFIRQVADRIETIDKLELTSMGDYSEMNAALLDSGLEEVAKKVKLVSLDVDKSEIHKFLQVHQNGPLSEFFAYVEATFKDAEMNSGEVDDEVSRQMGDSIYRLPDFVPNTHVTMGFAGRHATARALITRFRDLQGCQVEVTITAFLWSSTHAALEVETASTTAPAGTGCDNGQPVTRTVPPSDNQFQHITVWCAPGHQAFQSNQLPKLVASGDAHRVDFDRLGKVVGRISFWNHRNEAFHID